MSALIEVTDVTLAYRLDRSRIGTFKEYALQRVRGRAHKEYLMALNEVSFSVSRGEVFAIVGPNGAGKTTMMKIVARVLPPTTGRVVVRGAVAPMISLGAGFDPELTGYENILLLGTLLGREPDEMRHRAAAIAEWAELTEFLDVPIRSYSSGMLARLGFSIAADVDPDVLILDEVLSVGDESFQHKSFDRMGELMSGGTAVLLVSHVLDKVEEMADRVMWLDHGHTKMIGDPTEVIAAYRASVT